MKNKKIELIIAKGISNILEMNLKTRANTASCILWYEPKRPANLLRYQREKYK